MPTQGQFNFTGQGVGQTIGRFAGGTFGSALGGPIGGYLGQAIGRPLGGLVGGGLSSLFGPHGLGALGGAIGNAVQGAQPLRGLAMLTGQLGGQQSIPYTGANDLFGARPGTAPAPVAAAVSPYAPAPGYGDSRQLHSLYSTSNQGAQAFARNNMAAILGRNQV